MWWEGRRGGDDDDEISGDGTEVGDLEGEIVHVGCETEIEDLLLGGGSGGWLEVGGGFDEDVEGCAEGGEVDWHEGIVNVDSHCDDCS